MWKYNVIKQLTHNPIFLSLKSEVATKEDMQVAEDLLNTLIAHKDGCVGMAANMIGVRKRIIAFDNEGTYMIMFNPKIIKKSEPYETEEGCLSLIGGPRKCKRYKTIKSQMADGWNAGSHQNFYRFFRTNKSAWSWSLRWNTHLKKER